MKTTEQLAFLLHSRPYKENQVILDFLTQHDGKVSAISYLGTSLKTSKKALLQVLTPLSISLSGQSNLKKLASVEAVGKAFQLTGNTLYSVFYLNELLVKLLPSESVCERLFQQYSQSLQLLNEQYNQCKSAQLNTLGDIKILSGDEEQQKFLEQHSLELILRHFENALLEELGVAIDFSPVVDCKTEYFTYQPEQGFEPLLAFESQVGAEGNNRASNIYEGKTLALLAQKDYSTPAALNCFKRLMRTIINHLLGNKPLNSRNLFIQ